MPEMLRKCSYGIVSWKSRTPSYSFAMSWPFSDFWVLEMWLTKELRQIRSQGAEFIRADFCAYGMPWKKAPGFHQGFTTLHDIAACCKTHNNRCQFTSKRHITLVGKGSDAVWLTRRAQPYPVKLCEAIAEAALKLHHSL